MRFSVNRREWRLPDLLSADELVSCDESKDDLRVIIRCLDEVYKRIVLQVHVDNIREGMTDTL